MRKHLPNPYCWCTPIIQIDPFSGRVVSLWHNDQVGASMGLSPLLMAGRLSEYDDGVEKHFVSRERE